jgi:hypothetical protein
MLSVVLLPIQRALITPPRIFRLRSLLLWRVNVALIVVIHPVDTGFFIVLEDLISSVRLARSRRSVAMLMSCFSSHCPNQDLADYLFLPIRTMRGFKGQARAWKGV